ncbi:MAG: TonB family protein [Myxococcales bacterium]|nr:TonB family protein [Myxococcales bacterium]
MALRYVISGAFAFGVTFALFFGMQAAVAMGSAELKEDKAGRVIDFVRVKREAVVKEKERVIPNRPKALDQPNAPDLNFKPTGNTGGGDMSPMAIAAPKADVKLRADGLGAKLKGVAVRDSKKTPLMRINPEYPLRARQDGIEGFVQVRFDIDPTGRVQNARVTAAKPRGIFEQAALRAIKKWRYRPTVEGGKAVWERGQRVRLPFRLNN